MNYFSSKIDNIKQKKSKNVFVHFFKYLKSRNKISPRPPPLYHPLSDTFRRTASFQTVSYNLSCFEEFYIHKDFFLAGKVENILTFAQSPLPPQISRLTHLTHWNSRKFHTPSGFTKTAWR